MAEWRIALARNDDDRARKVVWLARDIFDRFAHLVHPACLAAAQQDLMELEQAGSRHHPIDFERMASLMACLRSRFAQEIAWARENGSVVPDFAG